MTIKVRPYSDIRGSILAIGTKIADFTKLFATNGEVHEIACESLQHCRDHGDVSLCKMLYDTVYGDGKNMVQADALKYWFAAMGPLTARQGNWKLKENWTKDMFLLEKAEATPIIEFAPEKEQRVISWSAGNVLSRLDSFLDKTRNSFQENVDGKRHFVGDFTKSEEFINNVITYARKLAASYSPADLGLLSNDEQNTFQKPEVKAQELGSDKLPEQSAGETTLIREGQVVEQPSNEIPAEQAVG